MQDPRVGEIWDVVFSPHVGHEQGGIRPALVISNDQFNDIPHSFRIVIPLTGTDRGIRRHVRVDPPQGGLTKPSFIMCEQVKSLSVDRFRNKKGEAPSDLVKRVQGIVGRFVER